MAPPIRTYSTLHGRRPPGNLAPAHASQQDRHGERRQLLLAHNSACVRVHDQVDLVVG
ncbi:MAG: hypothetical protein ACRDQD_19555 [Nocardioidaceae bacterium]